MAQHKLYKDQPIHPRVTGCYRLLEDELNRTGVISDKFRNKILDLAGGAIQEADKIGRQGYYEDDGN